MEVWRFRGFLDLIDHKLAVRFEFGRLAGC